MDCVHTRWGWPWQALARSWVPARRRGAPSACMHADAHPQPAGRRSPHLMGQWGGRPPYRLLAAGAAAAARRLLAASSCWGRRPRGGMAGHPQLQRLLHLRLRQVSWRCAGSGWAANGHVQRVEHAPCLGAGRVQAAHPPAPRPHRRGTVPHTEACQPGLPAAESLAESYLAARAVGRLVQVLRVEGQRGQGRSAAGWLGPAAVSAAAAAADRRPCAWPGLARADRALPCLPPAVIASKNRAHPHAARVGTHRPCWRSRRARSQSDRLPGARADTLAAAMMIFKLRGLPSCTGAAGLPRLPCRSHPSNAAAGACERELPPLPNPLPACVCVLPPCKTTPVVFTSACKTLSGALPDTCCCLGHLSPGCCRHSAAQGGARRCTHTTDLMQRYFARSCPHQHTGFAAANTNRSKHIKPPPPPRCCSRASLPLQAQVAHHELAQEHAQCLDVSPLRGGLQRGVPAAHACPTYS